MLVPNFICIYLLVYLAGGLSVGGGVGGDHSLSEDWMCVNQYCPRLRCRAVQSHTPTCHHREPTQRTLDGLMQEHKYQLLLGENLISLTVFTFVLYF